VAQNSNVAVFASEIQLLSKEVCCKVCLCENFQRQSYSYIIPISNGRWIAGDVPIYLKFALKATHPSENADFDWVLVRGVYCISSRQVAL